MASSQPPATSPLASQDSVTDTSLVPEEVPEEVSTSDSEPSPPVQEPTAPALENESTSSEATLFAPETPGYAYEDGALLYKGKLVARVVQNEGHYQLLSADGVVQNETILAPVYGNALEMRSTFPTLSLGFQIRTPEVSFAEILASWIDHKVLVKGKVKAKPLRAYAEKKGIPLANPLEQQVCRRCRQQYRECRRRASRTACRRQFKTCSHEPRFMKNKKSPCGGLPVS